MTIHFSRHVLRCAALFTLLLPAAVFLLTWVRPLIALPCAAMLAAAFCGYVKSRNSAPSSDAFGEEADVFECRVSVLALMIACALMWTFFSGIGGLFYQTEDHYGRNAIFHDMLNQRWPVYFEGTPYALTYYIAYWLLPALAGKAAAALFGGGLLWGAANAALFLQTVWCLTITLLLYLSLLRIKTAVKSVLCLLLFVLFSGMDGLMIPFFPNWWNNQIEWWAQGYQFSSNTTCLFWVYNQALPAWLAMMVLMSRPGDIGSYALIGLAAFPFSPMPFIGLMVYFVGLALLSLVQAIRKNGAAAGAKKTLVSCLTARNLLACTSIAPSFILYFMANDASSGAPLRFDLYFNSYGTVPALLRLALFLVIEFAAYSLCIGRRFFKNPVFLLTQLSLVLAPMLRIGYGQDFSMRASIPGLIAMTVFCAKYLIEASVSKRRLGAWVLSGLLLVGSITPLLEFARGVYKAKTAGTIFLASDPFQTVLHPEADTHNFICKDVTTSTFYKHFARKGSLKQ